ncbi:hypothetical protein [Ramlibacter humi]|uniref:Uncharacterized protein n=1 Tax=Ramlibacter humi TaxID=2530451 RepID=A0A4Z0BEF7_9BURK|nr:hypothetical protein [Ramlibacter humi]TFY97210.1 hypothetical protein EZ216_19220 [Ramlibacter humi]
MLTVRKLFQREPVPATEHDSTQLGPQDPTIAELQEEYRAILLEVFRKAGIDASCVEVDARHMGTVKGRPLFQCMLRLVRWERQSGLRLLVGLLHLERAARRQVAGSWVAEASHFGGLWLHPTTAVLDGGAVKELGLLLAGLEQGAPGAALAESMWSLPPELREER